MSKGEDIGRDRLADDQLLNAAYIANLPVAFRTLRMRIVAPHTRRPHDDWSNKANAAVENRPRNVGQLRGGLRSETRQSMPLEDGEEVWSPHLKWISGDEAIRNVRLLLADHLPEFDRQCSRDRNGPWNALIIVHHLGACRRRQDATDDVRGVVGAN